MAIPETDIETIAERAKARNDLEKANEVLKASRFPDFMAEVIENYPLVEVVKVDWDQYGENPLEEGVIGKPNSAGYIFKKSKERRIVGERGHYQAEHSFSALIIEAHADGTIRVIGENTTTFGPLHRYEPPEKQLEIARYFLDHPTRVTFTRPVATGVNGLPIL